MVVQENRLGGVVGVKGQVQPRGVETRQAILDAAIKLFGRGGSNGTSVAEVAAEAGVSPANVLHHFGSKQKLLLDAIVERGRRDSDEFVGGIIGDGGIAMLRNLVTISERNVRQRRFVAAFIVLQAENAHRGAAGNRWYVTRNRRVRTLYADGLRRGQARGEIRADLDCDAKAAEILAFFDGVNLNWLVDPDVDLVGVTRAYVESVIRDVTA